MPRILSSSPEVIRNDDICLRYALSVKHSYIGMIGSKGKVALTFDRLAADGISREP